MEKQYEKDTLRMLERIQKSRSFEKQQQKETQASAAGNSNHNNNEWNARTTATPIGAATQRSSSLTDPMMTQEPSPYHRYYECDNGYYIGEDGCDRDCDAIHNEIENEIENENENGHRLLEEEDEIFELDL